ncbi:MAG: hypothetical protein H6667_11870 [Ardenticatenaceae bacterium]|nr:hypothetical protein [Ardenticatenaceae bacterium]
MIDKFATRAEFIAKTMYQHFVPVEDWDQEDVEFIKNILDEVLNTPLPNFESQDSPANPSYNEDAKFIPTENQIQSKEVQESIRVLMSLDNYAPIETFLSEDLEQLLEFIVLLQESVISIYSIAAKCFSEELHSLDPDNSPDEPYITAISEMAIIEPILKEMLSDLTAASILMVFAQYKQAISQLRNVLELAVLLFDTIGTKHKSSWEKGTFGVPGFTSMLNRIKNKKLIDHDLYLDIRTLYFDFMSSASHSHKGRMNSVRSEKRGYDKFRFHEYQATLILLADTVTRLFDIFAKRVFHNRSTNLRAELEKAFNNDFNNKVLEIRQDIICTYDIELSSGRIVTQYIALKRDKKDTKEIEFQAFSFFGIHNDDGSIAEINNLAKLNNLKIREKAEILEKRIMAYTEDSRDIDLRILNLQ